MTNDQLCQIIQLFTCNHFLKMTVGQLYISVGFQSRTKGVWGLCFLVFLNSSTTNKIHNKPWNKADCFVEKSVSVH